MTRPCTPVSDAARPVLASSITTVRRHAGDVTSPRCCVREILNAIAPQRRYRKRLQERGGELRRAAQHTVVTDAQFAANARLAQAHSVEYAHLLRDEFNARGLDFKAYLEAHNIAAGSI